MGKKPFRYVGSLQLVIRRQRISLKLLNKTLWEIIIFAAIFSNFIWQLVAIFKTGNGESGNGNGERGTGNGESLKWGIFKSGNL